MRKVLCAIALAIAVCPSAFAHHAIIFVAPPAPGHRTIERDLRAESQIYCLTLAIYFEGGSTGEPEVGQRHIARVIHERARANLRKWGGADICDVVFYMRKGVCQFSFTCLPVARRTPGRGGAWLQAQQIAEQELQGINHLSERAIRYYMNAALTPLRNACRFRKEFVKVVDAGRHEFFREPTAEERSELANGKFEECERYAAQLREQEAKRKRLAVLKKKKKPKRTKLAVAR
ncbi:cell wall hydrolase [Bradyrhizobium sp. LHD-71]|uniref:cell wall hydrolase n=1 Tax=Bradyrhizobium sp. LHD-71 TaxID=3072141 RepID=UPI00280F0CA3|nr:cell wall hydrolase [Bradyrhizobium sp. LHD-71]MDQ8732136.1 cell wall hydrolase [Bradyrhizobium sp. LHD-71]